MLQMFWQVEKKQDQELDTNELFKGKDQSVEMISRLSWGWQVYRICAGMSHDYTIDKKWKHVTSLSFSFLMPKNAGEWNPIIVTGLNCKEYVSGLNFIC